MWAEHFKERRGELTDNALNGVSTGVSYGAYGLVVGIDKQIMLNRKSDGSLALDPNYNVLWR